MTVSLEQFPIDSFYLVCPLVAIFAPRATVYVDSISMIDMSNNIFILHLNVKPITATDKPRNISTEIA
jgi:hypothetical protein